MTEPWKSISVRSVAIFMILRLVNLNMELNPELRSVTFLKIMNVRSALPARMIFSAAIDQQVRYYLTVFLFKGNISENVQKKVPEHLCSMDLDLFFGGVGSSYSRTK